MNFGMIEETEKFMRAAYPFLFHRSISLRAIIIA